MDEATTPLPDDAFFQYTHSVHWLRLSPDGTILETNDAVSTNWGVSAASLVGRCVFDFVTATDAQRMREEMRNPGRRTEPLLLNFCDAHHGSYSLVCWLVVNQDGLILIGEPPLRDDQNLQRELLRITQDLALLARERSRLVDAERQARIRAEAADRDKDRALAILAHELRQPLGVMRFAAEVLARGGSEGRGGALSTMGRQITQLTRLVDDLLDVARMRQNKLPMQLARVDLGTLIGEVADTARRRASNASIDFAAVTPDAPVWIHADGPRMTQVLSNLVDNALKFTEPGGSISLSMNLDGADAAVRVVDTGRGIAPETLPRIFQLFAQQSEGERGGLGIGLAIAHGIVMLHGGSIGVHSGGLGQGAEFVVRLPVSRSGPGDIVV